MKHHEETGLEFLNSLVRAFSATPALARFTPEELISLYRACRNSQWVIPPDEWHPEQIVRAISYGDAPNWERNESGGLSPILPKKRGAHA